MINNAVRDDYVSGKKKSLLDKQASG